MNFKIPDKLTFKRLEVIKLTKLEGRVLDYWEREFGGLNPVVNQLGEKFYTRQDVEIILKIKQLLIVEKKDKTNVRRFLRRLQGDTVKEEELERLVGKDHAETLQVIKSKLQEILTILDKNVK